MLLIALYKTCLIHILFQSNALIRWNQHLHDVFGPEPWSRYSSVSCWEPQTGSSSLAADYSINACVQRLAYESTWLRALSKTTILQHLHHFKVVHGNKKMMTGRLEIMYGELSACSAIIVRHPFLLYYLGVVHIQCITLTLENKLTPVKVIFSIYCWLFSDT